MPDMVTEYISGIPMEQRPWYEDPRSIAELYEWMSKDGTQPFNVSLFIRNAKSWEAQYLHMRHDHKREVMLEQSKACKDAPMGTAALTDGKVVTDDQTAA